MRRVAYLRFRECSCAKRLCGLISQMQPIPFPAGHQAVGQIEHSSFGLKDQRRKRAGILIGERAFAGSQPGSLHSVCIPAPDDAPADGFVRLGKRLQSQHKQRRLSIADAMIQRVCFAGKASLVSGERFGQTGDVLVCAGKQRLQLRKHIQPERVARGHGFLIAQVFAKRQVFGFQRGAQLHFGKPEKRTDEQAIALLKAAFAKGAAWDGPMPGQSARECGNYINLDVDLARKECAFYEEVIRDWSVEKLVYPTE